MDRQLDHEASRVLGATFARFGIDVTGDVDVRAVLGGDRFTGLELSDGRELAADLLVLCCGVRPRIELAVRAGLACERGVLVDDELRTVSDPAVFAIGECAQHRGRTYGLVAPAWEQARVAASVIASAAPLRYEGSLVLTRLKAAGIELAAMGDAHTADDDDATADIVRFVDAARGIYQKLVVRDGRLVGAILLGDTRTIGTITQLFDRGATVPTDRAALLMVRRNAAPASAQSPVSLPGRATICQCNGVTKAAICDAWQDGARTVGELAACTRATTGCGTCRDVVDGLLEWLAAADAEPRARPPGLDFGIELEAAPV